MRLETHQLSIAHTKLSHRMTSLRMRIRSLSRIPSATSFIRSTSSSSKLLWLSCDICDLIVVLELYSRASMEGVEDAMMGRLSCYANQRMLRLRMVGLDFGRFIQAKYSCFCLRDGKLGDE